jgi:hypothetical protein
VSVLGPSHAVEMSLVIAVAFDEQGRVAEILVRPDDQMLFDRVLNAALGDFVAS